MLWTDLVWVTADKKLWLPASQMRPGSGGSMADGPNYILSILSKPGHRLLITPRFYSLEDCL